MCKHIIGIMIIIIITIAVIIIIIITRQELKNGRVETQDSFLEIFWRNIKNTLKKIIKLSSSLGWHSRNYIFKAKKIYSSHHHCFINEQTITDKFIKAENFNNLVISFGKNIQAKRNEVTTISLDVPRKIPSSHQQPHLVKRKILLKIYSK